MRADRLVHQRLRERRLVGLVVAEAPVAEHVDHDRPLEFLPELGRELGGDTTASGSSPFTWKIGASIILATSDG